MPPPRVLILDGHSRAALECVQSLGRRGVAVDLAVGTENALSASSSYVAHLLHYPGHLPHDRYLDWLRQCAGEADYSLIVPTTEASLLAIRQLAEDDPLRARMVLPDNRALDTALDKAATCDLAKQLGVPVPAARLILDESGIGCEKDFPLVLKPVNSKVIVNGRMTTVEPAIVKDEAARRKWLTGWLPHSAVLQQQYIHGIGIGVEVLYDRGRLCWYFGHERLHEWPLTGGASTYRRSFVPPPGLLTMTERLLDALRWHGVAMVEFKRCADQSTVLMEINPRLWGSLALSIDAGTDFPLGLMRLAMGEDPGPQPRYSVPYYTRHPEADLPWIAANFRADHNSPLLLTRPRLKSFLEWMRPLAGRESWDHFDWGDLGITRRMLSSTMRRFTSAAARKVARRIRQRTLRRQQRSVIQRLSRHAPVRRLLFLCYGNICRSPFAHLSAARLLPGIEVESAGFHPVESRSTPSAVAAVAARLGVDLSQHRSSCVTEAQLARADMVILMDIANDELLRQRFPNAAERAVMLGLFAAPPTLEIEDPYERDEKTIEIILTEIQSAVQGLDTWIQTQAGVSER